MSCIVELEKRDLNEETQVDAQQALGTEEVLAEEAQITEEENGETKNNKTKNNILKELMNLRCM